MVGTVICGKSLRVERAFPRPIVDPPPTDTIESTFLDSRIALASSVMCNGLCVVACADGSDG